MLGIQTVECMSPPCQLYNTGFMHLKINYIITKLKSFNIKKYSLTSNPTLNKTSEVLENNIWLGGSCCENGDRVSKKDRKDQYLHEVS